MTPFRLTEAAVEDAALAWPDGLGRSVAHGRNIASTLARRQHLETGGTWICP